MRRRAARRAHGRAGPVQIGRSPRC
jgi:hypothetical protein